jgi:S1-C subfamily serine protease
MVMLKKLFLGSMYFLFIFLSSPEDVSSAKTADEANNIEVYKKASLGVVNVSSVVVQYDFFNRPIPQEGTGSGAIIDEKGYIVTNNHVIQNARSLEVSFADGSKRSAILVGTDPDNDLAVIKVDDPDRKLTVIPMGSSKDLEVGQKVLAIGNPFGLGQTLTTGIISSLDRSIRSNAGSIIPNMVQTDAAINPGNSGGPLLNSDGEMIGINTAILGLTGTNIGVGFAIPVDTVKKVVPRLISGKFSIYGIRPLVFFTLLGIAFFVLWRKVVDSKERV